jgi:cold shock CspA family protein
VVQRREGLWLHHARERKQDCFVHHTAIKADGFRSLAEGDRVEFDIVEGQKGPAAENVSKVGSKPNEQRSFAGNGGRGASGRSPALVYLCGR